MKKYAFGLPELEYLGHIISKDGLKADPTKCKAIQEWPQPTNLGKLQFFLSMASYFFKLKPFFYKYSRSIVWIAHKNVNCICAPSIPNLCMYCKKHCMFHWFCACPIFIRLFNKRIMQLTLRLVLYFCNARVRGLYDWYHSFPKPWL